MNRIKELRKRHNMLQKDLASLLKVSQQTCSNYEAGRHEPDHNSLVIMADYFNVSVDYILGRSDNPQPPAPEEKNNRLALLVHKLRKAPDMYDLINFIADLPPEKREAVKTIIYTAFKE